MAFIVGFAQLVFLFNLIWSIRNGRDAGGNPWRATSLEWQTAETPPATAISARSCRSSIAGPTTTACRAPRKTSSRRTSPGTSAGGPGPLMSDHARLPAVIVAIAAWWLSQQRLMSKPWLEAGTVEAWPGTESGSMPAAKIGLGVFLAVVGCLFALFTSAYFMRMGLFGLAFAAGAAACCG